MATQPKPAAAPTSASAPEYIVAKGVLVVRDRKTNKNVELKVGQPYTPVDTAERTSLLAAGRIVDAAEFAAKAGGAPVAAVIASANERADDAEARLQAVMAMLTDEQKAALAKS